MFKEVTPEEADKLAEAGLLWYDCVPHARPGDGSGFPATWFRRGTTPSELRIVAYDLDYKFFILTEE